MGDEQKSVDEAITIADSDDAVWVQGEVVEAWLNSWEPKQRSRFHACNVSLTRRLGLAEIRSYIAANNLDAAQRVGRRLAELAQNEQTDSLNGFYCSVLTQPTCELQVVE